MSFTQSDLDQFSGSLDLYRYLGGLRITDGIKFIASNGCGWFIDVIASYQAHAKVRGNERLQEFQLWELKLGPGNKGVVTLREDTDEEPVITQKFDYADAPFDLRVYVEGGVCLLPSEH